MKISVLQPEIVRGDIPHNAKVIQSLMGEAAGELLLLAEYALTGSLILDGGADTPEEGGGERGRALHPIGSRGKTASAQQSHPQERQAL